VKVFLDECVDWRLSRDIEGHEVRTAHQMGWSSIKNGELLALAAGEFDVFVTVDRNLSFQQNLPAFAIAVVVLRASSNRLADQTAFARLAGMHSASEKGEGGVRWALKATDGIREARGCGAFHEFGGRIKRAKDYWKDYGKRTASRGGTR